MPLTRLITDALGVATISLVSLLVILGLICIIYSFYFRYRIRKQGYSQLGYFNKPWVIRITFVLFTIWWGFGEIIRLTLFRHEKSVVHSFNHTWQEGICKFYIISNLGLSEPCMFLTILFLLRASLRQTEFGISSRSWNGKMTCYVLLSCLPNFLYQLAVVLIGDRVVDKSKSWKVPRYFSSTAVPCVDNSSITLCTFPLLSTTFLGLYATVMTLYMLWLGKKMLSSVINKGLQRRVFFLILCVSSFFPLRVLLLGLSVLSQPGRFLFEALVFTAFLSLLVCAGLAICMLVYCPIADSLSLGCLRDPETDSIPFENVHHDAISLAGNQSVIEVSSTTSAGRNSDDDSTKRGSISFRTMLKDESSTEVYEELSLFSPSRHLIISPPGSPRVLSPGQSIFPSVQISNY